MRRHCSRFAATCLSLPIGLPSIAAAAEQTATWLGGSGSWTDAARWSGGVIPNNSSFDSFHVRIDAANTAASSVELAASTATFGVNSLEVTAGDALRAGGFDLRLFVRDGVVNHGTVTVHRGVVEVGAGRELSGTGTFVLEGLGRPILRSAGASFTVGAGLTVRGRTGVIGQSNGALVNAGTVIVQGVNTFDVVTLRGSSVTNHGLLQVHPNSVLAFDTTFSDIAEFGAVQNNGVLRIAGLLDNAGRTFVVDGSRGIIDLTGTIRGGTLSSANGFRLRVPEHVQTTPPTLDGVRIVGELETVDDVAVAAGQELTGGGTVVLNADSARLISTGGTLTIGPGMTVRGFGAVGSADRPLVNRGRITNSGGRPLSIVGDGIYNAGTIVATGSAAAPVVFNGRYRIEHLGALVSAVGGDFRLAGECDNSNATLVNGAPTTWTLAGRIRGGVIDTLPGHPLVVPLAQVAYLQDVTLNGVVEARGDGATYLDNVTGTGRVVLLPGVGQPAELAGPGSLHVSRGLTVRGIEGRVGRRDEPLVIDGTVLMDSPFGRLTFRGLPMTVNGTLDFRATTLIETEGSLALGDGSSVLAEVNLYPGPYLRVLGDLDLSAANNRLTVPPGLQDPMLLATYTGALTGVFDHVDNAYLVDYSVPGQIIVRIPEPASVAAFALAATLLLRARLRRQPAA